MFMSITRVNSRRLNPYGLLPADEERVRTERSNAFREQVYAGKVKPGVYSNPYGLRPGATPEKDCNIAATCLADYNDIVVVEASNE